jgi:hypothetical protein
VTGSPMGVRLRLLSSNVMQSLTDLRLELSKTSGVRISLNTLLQVLIGRRLMQLGIGGSCPTYTIPVDLHRYLRDPSEFYPCNLVTQIRIKAIAGPAQDLCADCIELQRQVDHRLAHAEPLANLLSEALLGLSDSAFTRTYRAWLLQSINTDKRPFVLTNLGNLDAHFDPLRSFVDMTAGIFLAVPLMAGPHLVFSFSTLGTQGHLTTTYDPRVFSADQVEHIHDLFDDVRTL